jgi:hypothetical protein
MKLYKNREDLVRDILIYWFHSANSLASISYMSFTYIARLVQKSSSFVR